MKQVKPFLTINEQIKLLKKRGLIINNNQYNIAKEFLLNNNYYRISGYSLTLRNNNTFHKTASLDTLMQIYEADRRMRHVMLSITENEFQIQNYFLSIIKKIKIIFYPFGSILKSLLYLMSQNYIQS